MIDDGKNKDRYIIPRGKDKYTWTCFGCDLVMTGEEYENTSDIYCWRCFAPLHMAEPKKIN